jgi:hypothetical protein
MDLGSFAMGILFGGGLSTLTITVLNLTRGKDLDLSPQSFIPSGTPYSKSGIIRRKPVATDDARAFLKELEEQK